MIQRPPLNESLIATLDDAAHGDLFGGEAEHKRHDEMRAADGSIRPHWHSFVHELAALSPEDYERGQAIARATIRDNGVTYNVYDDAGGKARPWELDIVPLILSTADWKIIEEGVLQRARLADALLRDIYGDQTVVAGDHLPPHLVQGHPQYLRPLLGVRPPGGVHVHFFSADLARATDGSWIVLSSRADAPSGVGYALENRIVVSQAFPCLFRDMQVRRLAPFFQAYRDAVLGLSPAPNPRAVLLTPGPYNETYFEHAYLSHYLGIALVEGEDLAVRDGQVFLKTLAGLERVDVVFRRVDSDFCDPLELSLHSALGVPGLVDAARAGGVVLANALGGSVVESPAMNAFLPHISRALLGEDLKIPDVATIWCGTEWGRKEAMARLDSCVVRDSFDARPLFSRQSSARLGAELSASERARLSEVMARRGATFVVQDLPPLGAAPVLENGRLVSRPAALRVFAAWTPSGYVVMPSALTRVAGDEHVRALTMQSGAASKDTWVLSDGPVSPFSLLKRTDEAIQPRRTGDEAPSRAMDNLFWLGRYVERAENLVRYARAVLLRLSDTAGLNAGVMASELARALLMPLNPTMAIDSAADKSRLIEELQSVIFERRHPYGLQRLISNVQRTAWSVRDRLSFDTWRTVQALTNTTDLPDGPQDYHPAAARSYLDLLVQRMAALSGLSAENMTRGRNWLFLDLGRRVERASHGASLLRQILSVNSESDVERIQVALEIADSAMTYRYRYLNIFQVAPLVDLLLLDDSNPRSVAFQLAAIKGHVARLPRVTPAQLRYLDKVVINLTQKKVKNADPNALAARAENGRRENLLALLDAIESAMPKFSDAIADAYFQHATRRHSSGAPRREVL